MPDASDVGDSSLEGFQLYDAGHPDILAMTGKRAGERWEVVETENCACVHWFISLLIWGELQCPVST